MITHNPETAGQGVLYIVRESTSRLQKENALGELISSGAIDGVVRTAMGGKKRGSDLDRLISSLVRNIVTREVADCKVDCMATASNAVIDIKLDRYGVTRRLGVRYELQYNDYNRACRVPKRRPGASKSA